MHSLGQVWKLFHRESPISKACKLQTVIINRRYTKSETLGFSFKGIFKPYNLVLIISCLSKVVIQANNQKLSMDPFFATFETKLGLKPLSFAKYGLNFRFSSYDKRVEMDFLILR